MVYSQSTVNGETISIQYFHLQEDGRATGTVTVGQIIGYQGYSGNLKGAIQDKIAVSHLHIKVKDSDGNTVDPRDYLGTEMDENGNVIENTNCN